LTTEAKLRLVDAHREELGLNACVQALRLSKSTWHRYVRRRQRPDRDAGLVALITSIIAEHPGYGWRRIQTELAEEHGFVVNHKRLKRVLRERQLGLHRAVAAKRRPSPAATLDEFAGALNLVHGRAFGPLEAFSTDFTELKYGGGNKAWLMALVDIHSKLVVGWAVGPTRNRALAQQALEASNLSLQNRNASLAGTVVHHDKDSVYTSYDWLRSTLIDHRMRVSFSEHGAKHNPWVESLWSRLKLEARSLIVEADDLAELREVIDGHFNYHNKQRRHSALHNLSPIRYLSNIETTSTDSAA